MPEIERLQQAFIKQFRWITMEIGNAHSYVGMLLILEDGCVRVDIRNFIEKMLLSSGEDNIKECASPAGKDILKVDVKSAVLEEKARRQFHMTVAKLLYLTKRARPDIMTAIGFLCS